MLVEIGIVLGLFVIARLTIDTKVERLTTSVALVVSALAIIDLTVSGITQRSLTDRISRLVRSTPESKPDAALPAAAPTALPAGVTVTRAPGGSIQTPLGYGIVVAKDSTLQREWIAVHDASVPIQFDGTPGVITPFTRGGEYSNGEYRYQAKFVLRASADVRAVQVRFLTFDVWGSHIQTLSYEEVADVAAGTAKEVTGQWRLFSENDAEKFYASIAYVSRARLKDGRVIAAKDDPVIEEARKFSAKFTAQDLEPGSRPPQAAAGK